MQPSSSDIQQKRLQKELSMLARVPKGIAVKESPRTSGLSLIVEIQRQKVEAQKYLESNISSIKFEIMIEHSFPFSAPRILCRTSFCFPSLADGRDLLRDVLQKQWTPPLTIIEIIQLLPTFISAILNAQENNELKARLYGTFHLGQDYDIKELMEYESCSVFQAKELPPSQKPLERYLVISHSAILFFQPYMKKRIQATLIQWATIQSLEKLKRTLENPDQVQFHWRKIDESEPGVLTLLLENSDACINAIVQSMKNLGLKVDRNVATKRRLSESEVSQGAVMKKVGDIGEVEERLAYYESLISEGALTVENVQMLMELYNKAIEYYSALGDDKFAQYLQNMHIMLSREDIQVVLSSTEEQPKKQSGPKHYLPQQQEVQPKQEEQPKVEEPVEDPKKENEEEPKQEEKLVENEQKESQEEAKEEEDEAKEEEGKQEEGSEEKPKEKQEEEEEPKKEEAAEAQGEKKKEKEEEQVFILGDQEPEG